MSAEGDRERLYLVRTAGARSAAAPVRLHDPHQAQKKPTLSKMEVGFHGRLVERYKGAFENANVGALIRRAPDDRVVCAMPRLRRNPKPKEPGRPRVVEFLRKAIEWRRQLDAGEGPNKTEIARREGITRARVTQVMSLLRLAPEFRKQILTMSDTIQKSAVTERRLRPIVSGTEEARQEEPITSLMP